MLPHMPDVCVRAISENMNECWRWEKDSKHSGPFICQ